MAATNLVRTIEGMEIYRAEWTSCGEHTVVFCAIEPGAKLSDPVIDRYYWDASEAEAIARRREFHEIRARNIAAAAAKRAAAAAAPVETAPAPAAAPVETKTEFVRELLGGSFDADVDCDEDLDRLAEAGRYSGRRRFGSRGGRVGGFEIYGGAE